MTDNQMAVLGVLRRSHRGLTFVELQRRTQLHKRAIINALRDLQRLSLVVPESTNPDWRTWAFNEAAIQ